MSSAQRGDSTANPEVALNQPVQADASAQQASSLEHGKNASGPK